jgi:ferredoxin
MRSVPIIDRAECTDCESCLTLCPDVFRRNEDTGHIEVVDISEYPEDVVQEVMSVCPGKCIELPEN